MIEIVGWDNYQAMLNDMIDYSAVAAWSDEAVYVQGNMVKYDGIIYVADENITNNNTPNDCSQWSQAPVFDTDCYNTIWIEGGLRKIIAWYIFAVAAPSYPQILDVAGFSDGNDERMEQKINFYLNNIYKQITMMRMAFSRWHSKNGSCMPLTLCGVLDTDGNRTDRKDNL